MRGDSRPKKANKFNRKSSQQTGERYIERSWTVGKERGAIVL